jgi:hypothetical protein
MAIFNGPKIVKRASGAAEYAVVGEYTGSSFKKGELVYLSGGQARAVASDGQVVFGIAQEDASGTATTTPTVTVEVINPEDDVVMVCTSAPTYANRGIKYALVISANSYCQCDLTDTGHDVLTLVDLVYDTGGSNSGTSTTKAVVHFLPGCCQSRTGA